MQKIVPADCNTLLIHYLADLHSDLPVTGKYAGSPDRFTIEVMTTGGLPNRDRPAVFSHQQTILVWAPNTTDALHAERLAQEIAGEVALVELVGHLGGTPCTSVDVLSLPYLDPDPDTGRVRYSATYRLDLRATVTEI